MLNHMGNGQHTQNIQINKVIDENEKYVLFYRKTLWKFWQTQYKGGKREQAQIETKFLNIIEIMLVLIKTNLFKLRC